MALCASFAALLFAILVCFAYVPANAGCYTHMFSFGDSFTDNGNYMRYKPTVGPGSVLPYGETYFHHPTGRFSNGRLIMDFIAEALKMPFLKPYLGCKKARDFQHGANFAVNTASALSKEFFKNKGLTVYVPYTLEVQMMWFEKVLHLLSSSDQESKRIMESSLFLMGEFGLNDYALPLLKNRTLDEVKTYIPSVIKTISRAISNLTELGAKTVIVPGIVPLGCSPVVLNLFQSNNTKEYEPKTGCMKPYNELVVQHNGALMHRLDQLRLLHPNVNIIYADYYNPIMRIITSPAQYGFGNTPLFACCGGNGPYNVNFTASCGSKGAMVCSDPSKFVSWDGTHLTEAAYKVIANESILEGPYSILTNCKHY